MSFGIDKLPFGEFQFGFDLIVFLPDSFVFELDFLCLLQGFIEALGVSFLKLGQFSGVLLLQLFKFLLVGELKLCHFFLQLGLLVLDFLNALPQGALPGRRVLPDRLQLLLLAREQGLILLFLP